jgi:hypothetical protein
MGLNLDGVGVDLLAPDRPGSEARLDDAIEEGVEMSRPYR